MRIVFKKFFLVFLFIGCTVSPKRESHKLIIESDTSFNPKVLSSTFTTKNPIICFDKGHDNLKVNDGRYSSVLKLLESDGYKISFVEITFSSEILNQCDILYISAAQGKGQSKASSAFTDEEILIVTNWVKGGGSLLLMTDHYPMSAASEKLANAFGIKGSGGTVEDFSHVLKGSSDPTNIEFFSKEMNVESGIIQGRGPQEHLHKVAAFTGQSLSSFTPSQSILTFSDTAVDRLNEKDFASAKGKSIMLALKVGKGRAVVAGDATLFTTKVNAETLEKLGMNRADIVNKQLAINTFHWLSGILDRSTK